MKRPLSLAATLLAVSALALLAVRTAAHAQSQPPPPPPPSATCTFTNPSYSGKCVENATVPQGGNVNGACRAILSCLNNPMCTKTYCQATTIRTNWQLESSSPPR